MAAPYVLLALACLAPTPAAQVQDQLVAVPAERVLVTSSYWAQRLAANRATTLPALCAALEEHGYLANFDLVARNAHAGHAGGAEADAQVYRTLRAVALLMRAKDDAALRARAAAWIPRIAAAQEDGGYLDTYVAVARPGARFAELATSRELTCLAALIEAGIEWKRTTGEAALLDVAVRAAGRLERAVRDEKLLDPPGRPGVEYALALLFRETGREDWLWLADDLLLARGSAEGRRVWGPELQDMIPVRKLFTASGEARGYLALQRGMLELHAAAGEHALLAAVLNGWKDLSQTKSYVTGGVGVEPAGAFPDAFALSNRLARCAPDATVELIRLARRLLELTRQAAFADFEEIALYNALAAGSSPDGRAFLDACPLEARGGIARAAWHADPSSLVALAGFYPELARGAVLHDEDDVYVAHYLNGEASLLLPGGKVRVEQTTDYPWSGKVELRIAPEKPMKLGIHLRVPAWAGTRLRAGVDDSVADLTIDRGEQFGMWLEYERVWTGAEKITLEFPMPPRRIAPDPRVAADAKRVALARGPVIYAVEAVDNGGLALSLALPPTHALAESWEPGLAGGGMILRADGQAPITRSTAVETAAATRLTAIPYALIANRGPADFAVWLPESPEDAPVSDAVTERVGDLVVRASHCYRLDSLAALFDGVMPARSADPDVARATFRPHAGTKEWIEIELEAERIVSGVRAFWADDRSDADGALATPRAWRMFRRAGDQWVPLRPAEGEFYWTSTDRMREVPFDAAFATRALRVEFDLRPGRSAGLFELELVSP
jgi:hypothetical protein